VPESRSALAREIQQERPFHSLRQEGALGLFKTSDLLRQHFSRVIKPFGITDQQYNVLRILRGAGKDGLATLEIADRMIEKAPGITRLLDRLERRKFLRRKRSARDRRQVLCTLAAPGSRLLARLDAPANAADDEALGMLRPEELETLIRLLEAIREGLSQKSSRSRS
jgi:DNA-binding MarR family transcriptional regulator